MLSKSHVLTGLQCLKRLHLETHASELAEPPDPRAEGMRALGTEVGVIARRRFPGGVLVQGPHEEAVRATRALLADASVPAIYEAAFERDGVAVRVDALTRAGRGWDLVEVKSGTRIRRHHELDLAIQLRVVEGSVPVARAYLMHLEREYVFDGGPCDFAALFTLRDCTPRARTLAPALAERLPAVREALAGLDPPEVATGDQCRVPYRCPFFAHCHAGGPEHPLRELPRLSVPQLAWLEGRGIVDLRDVPDDLPRLSPRQKRVRDVVRAGTPFRDPAVAQALAAVVFPAHFLDFETASTPIPAYAGTRPFEAIPFQWSDHVVDGGEIIAHHEFLHRGGSDPRRAVATSLLEVARDAGSIVAYSGYEADVLAALASALPDLSEALHALRARIVDLLPIVRAHYYHPRLRGSFSIKAVLPAMVPGASYDDLEIREGFMAMRARAEMIDPDTPPARREELARQLLAYCGADTAAMVALYRALRDGRDG